MKLTLLLYWGRAAGGNIGVGEAFLYDATNIRLRNITVGYDFEKKWLEKTPFSKPVALEFVAEIDSGSIPSK